MKKTLQTTYKGLDIVAVNSWIGGFSLFVDGKKVAVNNKLFHVDRDAPVLSVPLTTKDGEEMLDIFVEAVFTVKILMQVDGQTIARSDEP